MTIGFSRQDLDLFENDRLLSEAELLLLTGFSKATLRRQVHRAEFPTPIRLSIIVDQSGREFIEHRWWYSDIQTWVKEQIQLANKCTKYCAEEIARG